MTVNGTKIEGVDIDPAEYENAERLGHLIWYEAGEIEQTWEEARRILTNNGFDPDTLPQPSPKKAYTLGLKLIRKMGNGRRVRVFARPIPNQKLGYVAHQVTLEFWDAETEGLEYTRQMTIWLDKGSGQLEFKTVGKWSSEDESIKNKLLGHMRRYQKKIHKSFLLAFVAQEWRRWGAVAVKSSGGIWFVPENYTPFLQQMEQVFEDFGADSKFYKSPILDVSAELSKTDIQDFVERDFGSEMKWLQVEIEEMLSKATVEGEIKKKALVTKREAVARLQHKGEMYEKLLGYVAKGIRTECAKVQGMLNRCIDGKRKGFAVKGSAADLRTQEREQRRTALEAAREAKKVKGADAPF